MPGENLKHRNTLSRTAFSLPQKHSCDSGAYKRMILHLSNLLGNVSRYISFKQTCLDSEMCHLPCQYLPFTRFVSIPVAKC